MKIHNIAAIAAFLILICAPTVQQLHPVVAVPPVVESRARVAIPAGDPIRQLWSSETYFPAYERHFNDVFGFRDVFIRVRNQIQYSLFGDSDQVIIGRQGWIADKSAVEVQQANGDRLTDQQWEALSVRIAALRKILHARGIYLIVVPIPLKNTVYPELFPKQAAKRPTVTGEARLRKVLSDDGVPFVDVYNILAAHRYPNPLYYRTDVHWNDAGVALAAGDLIRQLGAAMHVPVRLAPPSFRYRTFTGGDEIASLATFWSPPDVEPFSDETLHCGSFVQSGIGASFTTSCTGKELLPPTVLVGNSFMLAFDAVDLQRHFASIRRFGDLLYFGSLLDLIPNGTKIVIWQMFELEIGYQLQSDEYWKSVDRVLAQSRTKP